MRIVVETYWTEKLGYSREEYEDAAAPVQPVECEAETFRVGLSDGATESSFSGEWALCLAGAYHSGQLSRHWRRSVESLRGQWASAVGGRQLPWYAMEKLARGSHATLLGVSFCERRGGLGDWSALAVGDTCAAHVRGNDLRAFFPIARSDDFGSTPDLVSTVPGAPCRLLRMRPRSWLPGDTFYLMTDALAAWFLSAHEAGSAPWAILRDVETDAGGAFSALVAELRTRRELRNDDTTMIRVDLL